MARYLFFYSFLFAALSGVSQESPCIFTFFDNSLMTVNYYYSEVNYKQPSWIKNSARRLPVEEEIFFTPGNSLQLEFISQEKGSWDAEIKYHPLRGNDFFVSPDMLSFRLYLKEPIESIILPLIAIRKTDSTFTSYLNLSDYLAITQVGVWNHVQIPLSKFGISSLDNNSIKTLSSVCFKQNKADGKLHTIYLDQIELLPSLSVMQQFSPPTLIKVKSGELHIDIEWETESTVGVKYFKIYRSFDGKTFHPIGIRPSFFTRYTDFIGEEEKQAFYKVCSADLFDRETEYSNIMSGKTHSTTEDEFLDMIQEAHFRYYWDGAEPLSGLARENIPGRHNMVATGASGFGVMAILVGVERGFITREQAIERFTRIVDFLGNVEKFHGAVSHFIDAPTGKAEPFFGAVDNGGDLVETSFLFQGLLSVRQFFNKDIPSEKYIRESIDRLWKEVEWSWYRKDKNDDFLTWHWSKEHAWKINHPLIGWNETMITYLMGIFSPTYPIPVSMYYSGWAGQSEKARSYRKNWGGTSDGENYTNGNTYYGARVDVAVSNGGPLFFVHYSYFGLNPHLFNDKYTNYFENNRNICLVNYRYCVENPNRFQSYGSDCWGLSASDFAWSYQAQEPIISRDNGTIPPNAAIASFPYTPKESMDALKNYYRNFGRFLWGEYGFRDAFNLSDNWCSPIYMGLNQAPITIMIENYRSKLLWNLFMNHPDVKNKYKEIQSFESKPK